jgi:hypothetical protein
MGHWIWLQEGKIMRLWEGKMMRLREGKMMGFWLRLRLLFLAVYTIKFYKFKILMWLLVALAPAPHHLDGNQDPAPAPERQIDAAQATNLQH